MWPFTRTPTHLEFITARAREGDTSALWELAHMYFDGRGVEKNHLCGLDYLQKAADRGAAWASYALSSLCMKRNDLAGGVRWMQKAAEQGFGNAQGMLGIFYSSDKMCPKDLVKACVWLKVSASEHSSLNSEGRQSSERQLEKLMGLITHQQKAEVEKLSAELIARLPRISFAEHKAMVDRYENPGC